MSLLIDIWNKEPDTIELDRSYLELIMATLKQNAKDPQSNVLKLTSVHFLFVILNNFAQDKNK